MCLLTGKRITFPQKGEVGPKKLWEAFKGANLGIIYFRSLFFGRYIWRDRKLQQRVLHWPLLLPFSLAAVVNARIHLRIFYKSCLDAGPFKAAVVMLLVASSAVGDY